MQAEVKQGRNSLTIDEQYISFKARMSKRRTKVERIADMLTKNLGSMQFLVFHAIWFSLWIVINIGLTPIKPFDPYPFGFLTLVVSLEAIFFSIVILISENREQKISDIREEMTLVLLRVIEQQIRDLAKQAKSKGKHRPRAEVIMQKTETLEIDALEDVIEQEVDNS